MSKIDPYEILSGLSEINWKDIPPHPLCGQTVDVWVCDVVDGDTFKCLHYAYTHQGTPSIVRYTCRIVHVDCPELMSKNEEERTLAMRAKEFTAGWLMNKPVTMDVKGPDKYGRLLVDVWCGPSRDNLSTMLVRGGHAAVWPKKSSSKQKKLLL